MLSGATPLGQEVPQEAEQEALLRLAEHFLWVEGEVALLLVGLQLGVEEDVLRYVEYNQCTQAHCYSPSSHRNASLASTRRFCLELNGARLCRLWNSTVEGPTFCMQSGDVVTFNNMLLRYVVPLCCQESPADTP